MNMKGSDKIDMTINIEGEFLKISVDAHKQSTVTEASSAVKRFCSRLRKNWPDCTDRQILAMAAYQFAFWHRELEKIQDQALEMTAYASHLIDQLPSLSSGTED